MCGFPPKVVDEMTLDDYRRYARYWESHPPLHLLAAAYLGVKPKPAPAQASDDIAGLLALAPGGTATTASLSGR